MMTNYLIVDRLRKEKEDLATQYQNSQAALQAQLTTKQNEAQALQVERDNVKSIIRNS
jgi:hypothetical protein